MTRANSSGVLPMSSLPPCVARRSFGVMVPGFKPAIAGEVAAPIDTAAAAGPGVGGFAAQSRYCSALDEGRSRSTRAGGLELA
jgi:hypothetical protein